MHPCFDDPPDEIAIWIPCKPSNPTKLTKHVWDWEKWNWKETVFVKFLPHLFYDDAAGVWSRHPHS
jgi:hypothetical protein